MSSTTPAKHAILVLHGYGQSAASFMQKIGALRSEVKKNFDFIAIDGPFDCITEAPLPAPSPKVAASAASNDDAAVKSPILNSDITLHLEPTARAWYSFANVETTGRYDKFAECMQFLAAHCESRAKEGHAPYRGLLAFSQGTIPATVWASRLAKLRCNNAAAAAATSEAPEAKSTPTTHEQQQQLPDSMRHIEFCILASGLLPKDSELRKELLGGGSKIGGSISSLHMVGKEDKLVDPKLTLELAALFEDSKDAQHQKVVFEHDGGHVIPAAARKVFKQFLMEEAALKKLF